MGDIMEYKDYEANGITLLLAAMTKGVSFNRVSIPMLNAQIYAIQSEDKKLDITMNPNDKTSALSNLKEMVAYSYSNYYRDSVVPLELDDERLLDRRICDSINAGKFSIADNEDNPPARFESLSRNFLEIFRMTEFGSKDFATLHTAGFLASNLCYDYYSTNLGNIRKALDRNRETVEEYLVSARELRALNLLIENGIATDMDDAIKKTQEDPDLLTEYMGDEYDENDDESYM